MRRSAHTRSAKLLAVSIVMEWHPIDRDEVADVLEADEDGLIDWLEDPLRTPFDVDKAWHGLHAVLTGSAEDCDHPLNPVVMGGEEFGADLGYGPARYLSAEDVRHLASSLDDMDEEEFRAGIDLETLSSLDAYPDVWDRTSEAEDNLAWLTEALETVREGFHRAADHGQAMIVTAV